jgi:hypothetical protein
MGNDGKQIDTGIDFVDDVIGEGMRDFNTSIDNFRGGLGSDMFQIEQVLDPGGRILKRENKKKNSGEGYWDRIARIGQEREAKKKAAKISKRNARLDAVDRNASLIGQIPRKKYLAKRDKSNDPLPVGETTISARAPAEDDVTLDFLGL